jgi:hypothetical protein
MYVGVWSRLGNALYVSEDDGLMWKKRSVIFPTDYPTDNGETWGGAL